MMQVQPTIPACVWQVVYTHHAFADYRTRSFLARTCMDAWRASSSDLDPYEMLALLEATPPNLKIATWNHVEYVLQSLTGLLPTAATVYDYVMALACLRICPRLTPHIIRAVQLGLARDWGDSAPQHVWTTYNLRGVENAKFLDFAAAIDTQPDVNGPKSVYVLYLELVQAAVAEPYGPFWRLE